MNVLWKTIFPALNVHFRSNLHYDNGESTADSVGGGDRRITQKRRVRTLVMKNK